MPTLHNDTNTSISIGGIACPADSSVTISETQAQAIAPSLHGVDGFRVEYAQPEPVREHITKPLVLDDEESEEESDQ